MICPFLFVFTRPGQMDGEPFSDDVAVVRALTQNSAVRKFNKMYTDVREREVTRVRSWCSHPYALTDY